MTLLYKVECKEQSLLVRLEEKNSKRILYRDTLKILAKETDQAPLSLLTKIHLRSPNASRGSETLSFQQIEVSASQSFEAMELMAQTGRLFFQGKQLSFSADGPAKIYWKGEKHSEKACTLRAVLQFQGKEIPLEQCAKVFPGTPFWFLLDAVIGSISPSISWKWIELFLRGAVLLEGGQKKKFLEEDPPILWKEALPERGLEVFPELVLRDATGCFADLWMEYRGVGSVAFEDFAPSIQGKARLREVEQQWEKDLLDAGFSRKRVGASHYYCPSERARETLLLLLEVGWIIKDMRGRRVYKQTGCLFDLREEGGKIALRGQVLFGTEKGSLHSALEEQKKGKIWIDLNGDSVGLLDRKGIQQIEGEWKEETLYLEKPQIGAVLPLLDDQQAHWEGNLRHLAEGLREGRASLDRAVPGPLFRGELLPYQQKGVDWLAFLYRWNFSGLLADEMGLGKTVQVLAFFSHLAAVSRTNLPTLIVAPTSLLFNWKMEIGRFLPGASVYLHEGPQRVKKRSEMQEVSYILTSYAVLRLDEEFLSQIEFQTIVLDESNAIKTASTQTARAACRLKGRFRIALSGTPMENRIEELGAQFRFLLPGLFGERSSFQSSHLESIRRKIRPFILRRRKEEVQIDLPEKIEQVVWVEMEAVQKEVYDAYRQGLKSGLLRKIEKEGMQSHRMEVLEAILRLRQICCSPRLVGSDTLGSKSEHLLAELEEAIGEGRKVLVFSQFTSMLQIVKSELEGKGYTPLYLDGSTKGEERGRLVQAFQENPENALFLLSLKAGGVGLNLTAADTVFLLDPWWNDAVEKQAIDRAHRIGQKKTVIAKRYIIPGTIEEKILQLKAKKQKTADQLLDHEGEMTNWTEEDLLLLLND